MNNCYTIMNLGYTCMKSDWTGVTSNGLHLLVSYRSALELPQNPSIVTGVNKVLNR